MTHNVTYWRLARRQADVDDDQLRALLGREAHEEVYVEFVDGRRLRHTQDDDDHRWIRVPAGACCFCIADPKRSAAERSAVCVSLWSVRRELLSRQAG